MSNLIACVVFNVIGLGASYFLSFLSGSQKKQGNWGTGIFWGSWASLLFTYSLWLLMPDKLSLACYITFVIGLVGCFFLFKDQPITSFFKSDYFVSFLFLVPFLFIVSYMPRHCDELSHWVSLPQIFYCQNSLVPQDHWHTGNYTPLWTLQATFFQFFTPQGFDASLIYAVRINVFLSFFFIGFLSLYMLKKPLIVVLPVAFYILWIQGYKKQLMYFMLLFGAVYLSWKFKTAHMSEPWQYTFKFETLWDDPAIIIYKQLIKKAVQDGLRSFLFLLSLLILYRWKKEVFRFYFIFSLVYLLGLTLTYVYAFEGYQEAAIKASYVRYVKIVFVPAYVYAFYIMLSTASRLARWDHALVKKNISRYAFSFVAALLLVCFFYPSLSAQESGVVALRKAP